MVSYCNPHFDLVHTQTMDNQLVETPYSSSSSSSSFENFDLNDKFLGNKTKTNEAWTEIENQDDNDIIPFEQQQRENTIEEFLVKAGGINPRALMAVDPTGEISQHDDWFKLQMMQQRVQNSVAASRGFRVCEMGLEDINNNNNNNNNNEFNRNLTMVPSIMVPVVSSSYKEEVMEKTVERRRKRMIKNRESAARSRARKQAHTNQLELEVSKLRKTNTFLKKRKEARKHLLKQSTSEQRCQLRRTSSTSF